MALIGILLILLAISATFLVAMDLSTFLNGNIGDFRHLAKQNRQGHDFTFVRIIYNGRLPGYIKNWYTDFPTGDENLIRLLRRMTSIDVAPEGRAIPIHHPDLFNYPMIYSSEAGQMVLDESDGGTLREYLTRGGFWMIDDFWGTTEWMSFEREMKKVFPDKPIVEISQDHPIFHAVYDIKEKMQVPNIGYAYTPDAVTWEQDGYQPYVRGIFDDNGRLLVFINFNTDLMDASEWADDPMYPQHFSAYSYKVFTNAAVYALSH
jgi:hypothetical protein